MPKEISHLIFSDRALKNIEKSCPDSGNIIGSHYDLFLLGSLIPDTAFYDLSLFNKGKSISFLSNKVHTGRGGLDNGFLRRALEEGISGSNELFVFCCGLLSHQWADSLFHPFIVHFSGDYSHPDLSRRKRCQARHRFMEGLIDLKLMSCYFPSGNFNPLYVSARLKEIRPPEECLSLFVRSALPQEADGRKEEIISKLHRVHLFQLKLLSLYGKKYFKKIILGANRLSGKRFDSHAGLLYGNEDFLSASILSEEVHYKDPWSGQEMKASVEGISTKVIHHLSCSIEKYGEARKNSVKLSPQLFSSLLPESMDDDNNMLVDDFMDTEEMDKLLNQFLDSKG